MIIKICLTPHPDNGTICMRENNWSTRSIFSAGLGQWYACERGIGILHDRTLEAHWLAMRSLIPRRPAKVAVELGAAYALGDHD